ncbi:transmembrane protein 47-like [Babylonia areolata]|uniref:transmembrane protein 47-like n=1 Tax=Babylonia areolata TaxID=304850 RepID=UPI003FD5BA3F
MASGGDGGGEKGAAPTATTTIETMVIVRPLKVIAVILAALAMLLMLLSVAATTWLEANRVREGLWERCHFRVNETDMVDCNVTLPKDWLQVCRSLCLIALIFTFFGVVVTSAGLRSSNFRAKNRFYFWGMVLWFLADALQLSSLVTFPIKFLDSITTRAELHWQFGWAYGIGWGAAIFVFLGGLLLLIDKGAEEVVYREVTAKEKLLEEEDEATEVV